MLPFPLVSLSLAALTLAGTPAAGPLQRYALIVGANDGGSGRPLLRYAVTDAERFSQVLSELGGVSQGNEIVLRQPRVADLVRAFDHLSARVASARRLPGQAGRTEVVVYYSGHADEAGLLLGGDRFSYRSLRDRLDEIGADVRIAVLDACASGAFTRLKGGRSRPPFVVDDSAAMEGHAFLTSSAATESAQESDHIGGSYFTHYLVSGFRGAADVTGDGKVTLNEAYQFAFTETLGRTVDSKGGAQHPSYDINLSGTGDVVMTDVRQTTATLVLAPDLDGRVFIRTAAGALIAELHKAGGRRVELALEPGGYEVRVDGSHTALLAKVQVADGRPTVLEPGQFAPTRLASTRRRGGEWSRYAVAGRNRFTMVSGIWGNSGAVVTIGGRGFDVFGGAQYTRYLREDIGLTIGLDAFGAESDTDVVGGIAIPVTVQWNPLRRAPSRQPFVPFLSAGLVPVSRADSGDAGRQTTLGAQFGAGLDVYPGQAFSVGAKAAYNAIPGFGGSAGHNNYGGLQLSVAVGWLFGAPR